MRKLNSWFDTTPKIGVPKSTVQSTTNNFLLTAMTNPERIQQLTIFKIKKFNKKNTKMMIQKLPTHFFVAMLLLLSLSSPYSHALNATHDTPNWKMIERGSSLKCVTTSNRTVEFTYDYLIQGPEIFGAVLHTNFSVLDQANHGSTRYAYRIDDNSTNAGNYTSIVGSKRRVVQKIRHTFEKDGIYNVSFTVNFGADFVSDGRDREPVINQITGQIMYYYNYNLSTEHGMFDDPVKITGDSCYYGPINTDDGGDDDGDGDDDGGEEPPNENDDESGASSFKQITTNTIGLFVMAGLYFFWS